MPPHSFSHRIKKRERKSKGLVPNRNFDCLLVYLLFHGVLAGILLWNEITHTVHAVLFSVFPFLVLLACVRTYIHTHTLSAHPFFLSTFYITFFRFLIAIITSFYHFIFFYFSLLSQETNRQKQ